MLDPRAAIRNFREIVFAQFLLLFEAERTMICRDHLQVIRLQPIPQLLLVPLFAQRRSEYILRSFKPGRIEVLERQIKILRTGFGIHRQPAIPRLTHFFKGIIAAQMNDIDRRPPSPLARSLVRWLPLPPSWAA